MFYLFILESIGTSELMLIGLVALIVFGPRKLPELARMLGKAMNEFRRSTDEFKQTWEREVNLENEEISRRTTAQSNLISGTTVPHENAIQETAPPLPNEIVAPQIKEISNADFKVENPPKQADAFVEPKTETAQNDKRDWL